MPATAGGSPGADLGGDQIEHQRLLDDLDAAVGADRGDQGALDLGTRWRRRRRGRSGWVVAALPGQLQGSGRIAVELRTPGDQLGDLVPALGNQHAYGVRDAQPCPATRVSVTCCSTVSPSAWTEAIPPCAQFVDPEVITSFVTISTLPRSRHSKAAVSPAIPEPTTTTSTSFTHPGASAANVAAAAAAGAEPGSPVHRVMGCSTEGEQIGSDVGHHGPMLPQDRSGAARVRTWFDGWVNRPTAQTGSGGDAGPASTSARHRPAAR